MAEEEKEQKQQQVPAGDEQQRDEADEKEPSGKAAAGDQSEKVKEPKPAEQEDVQPFPAKLAVGRKVGMGRIFAENGDAVSVTFIEVGPCAVSQVKTAETDGYNAVQVAYGIRKEKHVTKPLAGHLKKSGLTTATHLREFRVGSIEGIRIGQKIRADAFEIGDIVNITGISKGLGFQGTVRRHGFGGGDKTHGQSDRYRAPGSIGSSSYPSRVFKGLRMAGRTGGETVTVKNLTVVGVDSARNILMIKGAVPGKPNNVVKIAASPVMSR